VWLYQFTLGAAAQRRRALGGKGTVVVRNFVASGPSRQARLTWTAGLDWSSTTAWSPFQDSKASVVCSAISSRNLFAGYYGRAARALRNALRGTRNSQRNAEFAAGNEPCAVVPRAARPFTAVFQSFTVQAGKKA
jgi:hypothetical protein